MRVDRVEAYPIRLKAKERLRGGKIEYPYYVTVLVKATCDGVEGWGEAMTRYDPSSAAALVRYFGAMLEGADLVGPSEAWTRVWGELRTRGHTRGTDVEALSGIDIALHDCFGRLRGVPLSRVFSKAPAAQLPAYAGSVFESRGPLAAQVEEAKALGLRGVKVKVGFGAERDAEILGEVRRVMPEGILIADANGSYDAQAAREACRRFREFRLAWFEEPVPADDYAGYLALRGAGVPIGAGESWFPLDFAGPVEEGVVDVLEPSVSRCGGVTVDAILAESCARRRIGFSPMVGMNSAVSLAASLHMGSVCPRTVAVEHNPFPNPLQTELCSGFPQLKRGALRVPTGPGLGVEVDARFVRRNSLTG